MTQHVAHRQSDEIAARGAGVMKLNKTAEEWAKLPSYCVGFLGQAQQDIATLHAEIARLQDLLHMAALNDEAMKFCAAWGAGWQPHSASREGRCVNC